MLQITEAEIKKRLAFDNPWWEQGAVAERFRKWPHRAYFDGFMELVEQSDINRAVVLMGPRRVGKTVMLTQAIQKLIDGGTPTMSLCYVSVDTPTYTGITLEQLLRWFMEIHEHDRTANLFVFFDEIQYHPDWERHLKSLVDSFPSIRFVASGSAAAALKMKSDESGAGRFTDFLLPPLGFNEFIEFMELRDTIFLATDEGKEAEIDIDIHSLNSAFVDYINFGGFPEAVIKHEVRADMNRFVANDIVDKVLLRDLPSLYGIADTQELKRFFTVLAYNTGMEVSFEGLAQASGIAKNTLRKYLDYLEAAFLIHRLYRVDQDARHFKRVTHFKVYLTNPSIRAALFGTVDSESPGMGPLAETALVSQFVQSRVINTCYYARWPNGEVDIVQIDPATQRPESAMEIKWSDRPAERPGDELRALIAFCKKNGLTEAVAFVKTRAAKVTIDEVSIQLCPLSIGCAAAAHAFVGMIIMSGRHPKTFQPFIDSIQAAKTSAG